MINWDEFEHIHVIKKLKQILNSWWNIDVVFTDERGLLRAIDPVKSQFCNPAVQPFLGKETSAASLAETVQKALEDVRTSGNRFSIRRWEMAGFDVAVVPINIEN